MKAHVHRGRGGRLLRSIWRRLRYPRAGINPDLLREDLLRSLKARFDEASKDLQNCPAGDWERKIALQKSLAYLAQVLISAARAYEEWGHDYQGEESDVEVQEKMKKHVDALREIAAQLPGDKGKGKDAEPDVVYEGVAAAAAEEDRQGGS